MTAFRSFSSCRPGVWIGALCFAAALFTTRASASVRVLVDQVGYDPQAAKVALVVATEGERAPGSFSLINVDSGKTVLDGPLRSAGDVYNWLGMAFWSADFSAWREPGRYTLRIAAPDGQVT